MSNELAKARRSGEPIGSENGKLSARDVQRAFDGTIASACALGISLEDFLEMVRLARTSDPRAARFLEAWETLDASEQQSSGAADAVCGQIGLNPAELLRTVAHEAINFSKCVAETVTALALPSVVACSVRMALTDEGTADRKMLFQHTGFLPTPRGWRTNVFIAQNGQSAGTARIVAAPQPEHTIRQLAEAFNRSRGMPSTARMPAPMADPTTLLGATPAREDVASFDTDCEDDDGT